MSSRHTPVSSPGKIPADEQRPPKKKVNGKRNREMGHEAERTIRKDLFNLGDEFRFACTTRASDRLLDSCGIDINYVPFIVQSKAGKQKAINAMEELRLIETKMLEKLPLESPWHNVPKFLIQLGAVGRGKKRDKYSDKVTMTYQDFLILIQLAYTNKQYDIKNTIPGS